MSQLLFDDITATVEIGFSTSAGANTVPFGALLANIVWTDVTAYVRGLSFQRGRSTELDQFQTGSASVVLSNADRRFDPLYASSPYAGALTPLRPIRIKLEHIDGASVTQTTPVFFGYIDGWPQTYETFGDATVTVNASDTFKVLNNITLGGYYAEQIAAETPTTWLRFDDGFSATIANTGSTGVAWRWVKLSNNTEPFGNNNTVAGLIANDLSSAGDFSSVFYAVGPVDPFGFDGDRTIEFWMQSGSTEANTYGLLGINAGDSGIYAYMASAFGLGLITVCVGQPGTGTFKNLVSNVIVNDNKPHHVVIVFGTTTALYVDGQRATTPTATSPCNVSYPDRSRIGGTPYFNEDFNATAQFIGTVDEFADYDRCFTDADVTDHYALGVTQFAEGERSDQRVQRVLDMIDWPADGVELGTGLSTVQGINTEGKTVLTALQECEAAEQGLLFADASGGIKFVTRDDFNKATTAATFGDSTGELGYQDIVIEQSDADIANQITVSKANGASFTKISATSQGAYWPRTSEVTDLIVDDDLFAEQLAIDLLRRYKDPQTRIRRLSGTVRGRSRADVQTLLDVGIGDRVTVKRRPQGVGAAISQDLQVQSVGGEIGTDNMVLSFDLGPQPTQGFVLDSSTRGVLGTSRLAL